MQGMTGYGRAEGKFRGRFLVVEFRSVNHRYCDLTVRLPKHLSPFEEAVKKKVSARFLRGHIEVSVSFNGASAGLRRYELDLPSAEAHYRILKKLKAALHLKGEIDLSLLSDFKEMITVSEPVEPLESVGPVLERTLNRGMLALEKMRREEGKGLAADLALRLGHLSEALQLIETRRTEVVRAHHQRLKMRVAELAKDVPVDPNRLAQEVAILADRCDISEEVVRLNILLGQFHKTCKKKEAVGRTLEFLLQEVNREVNTIGSKANDADISLHVVAMKSELEKIREQVQNIE